MYIYTPGNEDIPGRLVLDLLNRGWRSRSMDFSLDLFSVSERVLLLSRKARCGGKTPWNIGNLDIYMRESCFSCFFVFCLQSFHDQKLMFWGKSSARVKPEWLQSSSFCWQTKSCTAYYIKFAPKNLAVLPNSIGPKRVLIKVSRLKTLDFHSIGKHKWVFTIPSVPKKLHLVIG